MRLTKFIEHFKAAAVASSTATDDQLLKYLAVGRQLAYGLYMLLDNLTYPDASGIRKFEGAARLQKEAYRAWFVGISCNVIAGVYSLYQLQVAARKQQGNADGEKAVEAKKIAKYAEDDPMSRPQYGGLLTYVHRDTSAAHLQLLSDLCDLTIPSTGLGYVNFDDGIVGLAGTTSSLIGLFAAWAKTA